MPGSDTAPVQVRELRVRLGRRVVLDGVDLSVAAGRVTGVLGPNGSGKTTLLRAVFRGVRPESGAVLVDGAPVQDLRGRELARRVAAVVQEPEPPQGVSVAETVRLGRFPARGDLRRLTDDDERVVAAATRRAGVDHLLDRLLDELSGGERQRVQVARALAQATPVLVLDEPTNHLDVRHQFDLLQTLRELAATGVAVAVALHDLTLAHRYCDDVAVLEGGRVVEVGPATEVLASPATAAVFGVGITVADGRLLLDPA